MFQESSARMSPGSNVRMYPANNARIFQDSNVRMYLSNSAAMSQGSNARQYQGRFAKLVNPHTEAKSIAIQSSVYYFLMEWKHHRNTVQPSAINLLIIRAILLTPLFIMTSFLPYLLLLYCSKSHFVNYSGFCVISSERVQK